MARQVYTRNLSFNEQQAKNIASAYFKKFHLENEVRSEYTMILFKKELEKEITKVTLTGKDNQRKQDHLKLSLNEGESEFVAHNAAVKEVMNVLTRKEPGYNGWDFGAEVGSLIIEQEKQVRAFKDLVIGIKTANKEANYGTFSGAGAHAMEVTANKIIGAFRPELMSITSQLNILVQKLVAELNAIRLSDYKKW